MDGEPVRLNVAESTASRAKAVRATARAMRSVAGPPVATDDGSAAIARLGREFAHQVHADGLRIDWREDGEPADCLFVQGCSVSDALAVDAAKGAAELIWHGADGYVVERLTIRLPMPGGVIVVTAGFRQLTGPGRIRVQATAQRLMPIVEPLFHLWTLHLRSSRRETSLASAIDHSDVATVLIDGHGELIFVNEAAGRLIARGEGLRRNGTHLAAEQLADTLRLQATIEHALHEPSLGASTPVVALKRGKKRALLAAVVAHESRPGAGGGAEAVLYIFDPEQDLTNIAEPACKHYGLSPVETRLACLLVDGANLNEAAVQMRVREQTARTYLKQMFLKTDTNRQAEFVLLMLKSGVRLLARARPSFF